jgi:hypothetical protein
MATTIQTIVTRARRPLREATASFWSDAELLDHALDAISDLWRMVIDLHQEHYLTIDETNVSLAANTGTITGIPSDCFRIVSIEARDLSSSSDAIGLEFLPRDWNHPEMVNARRSSAVSPRGQTIYYTVTGKGPPVDTLSVRVAPRVTDAVNLTLAYVPTHGIDELTDNNPIPGQSDLAIQAWVVAHARAKEREDGSPDPDMLAIYATEKEKIRTALTPRQEQELETVEGMFEGMH